MSEKTKKLHANAEEEVTFGQTASLQPSSGTVTEKPVTSYQEDEEGIGKKYQNKMKMLRKLRRKKHRIRAGGDSSSSTDERNASDSSEGYSSKLSDEMAKSDSLSQKSRRSDKSDKTSTKKKMGFFKGLAKSLTKPFRRKSKKKTERIRTEVKHEKPAAKIATKQSNKTPGSKDSVTNFSSKDTKLPEKISKKESTLKLEKLKSEEKIPKEHTGQVEEENEKSSEIVDSDETSKLSTEKEVLDHGLETQTLASYINLIGLDFKLSFREEDEVKTDQERAEADQKLTEVKPVQNLTIVEGIDFDHLDAYDQEFLRLWDLDAGAEILDLMVSQSESYTAELKNLNKENEELAAELEKIRKEKQEAFFRIKDLETEAIAAENLYKKLNKLQLSEKPTSKVLLDTNKYSILAALLEQREELFRQLHDIRQKTAQEWDGIHIQERQIDNELSQAVKLFIDARERFAEINKQVEHQKQEIGLIEQELTYLVEEAGVFMTEDGTLSEMTNVRSTIQKLSQKRRNSPPSPHNFTKRLSVFEDLLQALKKSGLEAMKTVDDAHEELQWHLNRREDILKNLIKGYMEDKHIRVIDSTIMKVLQSQQVNIKQLHAQIKCQTSLQSVLETKWNKLKKENAKLRNQIARTNEQFSAQKGKVACDSAKGLADAETILSKKFVDRSDLQIQASSKHLYNIDSNEETWEELSVAGSSVSENWSRKQ